MHKELKKQQKRIEQIIKQNSEMEKQNLKQLKLLKSENQKQLELLNLENQNSPTMRKDSGELNDDFFKAEESEESAKPRVERKDSGEFNINKKHVTMQRSYEEDLNEYMKGLKLESEADKSDEPAKSTKSKKPSAFRRAFNANVSKPPKPKEPPKTGKSGNLRF
jgi:hypothetical protein